jgi:hypothetical protein
MEGRALADMLNLDSARVVKVFEIDQTQPVPHRLQAENQF